MGSADEDRFGDVHPAAMGGEPVAAVDRRPVDPHRLPDALDRYLEHTIHGISLRAMARREGCHPSTVMRQVRRYRNRHDDPLVDAGLTALGRSPRHCPPIIPKETTPMSASIRATRGSVPIKPGDDALPLPDALRILRRLAETGAVLAVAEEMPKAVVLRGDVAGRMIQTAVVDRAVAEAMALRDWIVCVKIGKLASYAITPAGRAVLAGTVGPEAGFAEAQASFAARVPATVDGGAAEDEGQARSRYGLGETPVQVLARRRDADGRRFLDADLVEAAERLREDFELAQMGPRVAQNWERFLTAGTGGATQQGSGRADGPRAARDRVALALRELGPGLGDAALRCCCFLEGMETVEKRLSWPARSGKVVLRIALQRLRQHYDAVYGRSGPLIG